MAQTPDDSCIISRWLSCATQSLHHDAITGSRPGLFWEVLERFFRDAAMFQESSMIKCRDSFPLVRLHSPDARDWVQSKTWNSLKFTKGRKVITLLNWSMGCPEDLLPGQPGCLSFATFSTFTQRKDYSPFTWSLPTIPEKGALEKGCSFFFAKMCFFNVFNHL